MSLTRRGNARMFHPDSPNPPQQCTGGSLPAPAANFTYDQGLGAKGHLSSLTDQAGSGSYTFDSLGRTTTEQRTTAGISRNIGYAYNLDGSLKQLTYPSGRVVNYTYDSAQRPQSAIDANGTQYTSSATYWANGAEYQRFMPTIYFRTDLKQSPPDQRLLLQ